MFEKGNKILQGIEAYYLKFKQPDINYINPLLFLIQGASTAFKVQPKNINEKLLRKCYIY